MRTFQNSNDDESTANLSGGTNDEDVWEQVSQEAAEWSLLIDKLDDVAALGAILVGAKPAAANADGSSIDGALPIVRFDTPDVSLRAIVCGGKGIVSELVAKWILHFGIDPTALLQQSAAAAAAATTESVPETESSESFQHYLRILRDHFPFSLESGVLLIHMAWEFMCAWSKQMHQLHLFKAAIQCLATIRQEDWAIKHGLCCMIWNAHLKIPMEATRKLINKTGRLPKETFCMQDIGVSDSLVAELLEQCGAFLREFSESAENTKMNLRYEEVLQEGPVSLSLLALQQNIATAETLELHKQLNHVLFMIAALNLKYPKPILTVFDAMSNQTFFTEINRPLPYVLPPADLVLQRKRVEFLCLAITATMDLIRVDLESVFLTEHIEWMDRIEVLSNRWGLDNDALKKHQVSVKCYRKLKINCSTISEFLSNTAQNGFKFFLKQFGY